MDGAANVSPYPFIYSGFRGGAGVQLFDDGQRVFDINGANYLLFTDEVVVEGAKRQFGSFCDVVDWQ